MIESWRWYGPEDPVPLDHVRQAGATGVVTALHHLYDGRAWTAEDVAARKAMIEAAGLRWTVCESIPVPSAIKLGGPEAAAAIHNWQASLRSLGGAGVPVVCFNFMPLVDWTRTELRYRRPDTGLALRFDMLDFAAYDLFVLQRKDAAADYPPAMVAAARRRFESHDAAAMEGIERNVIAGLPGGEGRYGRAEFEAALAALAGITADTLRDNLMRFLRAIVPVAEEVGVKLVIHPDDPPFSLFGLPRVVSTSADIRALLTAVPSPANNICLCSGSYGSRPDNDLVAMAREFGPRIQFVHLRNVRREPDGSFTESGHLEGDVDMVALIGALLEEEERRNREGVTPAQIPMRSDHGHLLLDDIGKTRINPGYSAIGRLKGLAELRGIVAGLRAGRTRDPAASAP